MNEAKTTDYSHQRCGDCARWKVPDSGCTYRHYINEGTLTARDQACPDYYPSRSLKEKREKPPEHKATGIAEEGPYEAIYHNDQPMFLVKTKDGFSIQEDVCNQGHKIAPKELGEFPYPPYGYSLQAIPSREDLFWRSRNEFDTFVDVDPIWKDYGAACVLLSYQQEKMLTVPYPFLLGDNESGKSSYLGVLGALCYRPMLGIAIPAADIYGYLGNSDSPGVILEDEAQGLDKDTDKAKIYKAGYAQGSRVPRTLILPTKRTIEYYRCFCLKAFAAEKMSTVKGFNERCVPIPMFHGEPNKAWSERDTEDIKRVYELRDTLLKWRLATQLEWALPEPALPFKGRMRELWKPVLQVTNGLPIYDTLLNFAQKQAHERMTGKQNTLEGHVVKVISELCPKDRIIPFNDIWSALVLDLQAKLDDNKPNKMDSPEFGEITKQKIGHRLREILSGKKTARRIDENLAWCYSFEEDKVERQIKSYGYNIVSKLEKSGTTEGVTTSETMEKDHETSIPRPAYAPQEPVEIANSLTNSVNTPQEVANISNSLTNPNITVSSSDNLGHSKVSVPAMDISNILAWLRMEFEQGNNPIRDGPKALEPLEKGRCPLCHEVGNLTYQIQFRDGSRIDALCLVCCRKINELTEKYLGGRGLQIDIK